MLRWNEVRTLIGPIVGTRLLPFGFPNPGRAMWRYRKHFVDVVAFRCDRYAKGFSCGFGCAFREGVRLHPAPLRCEFRASYLDEPRDERFSSYLPFEQDLAAQSAALEALAPRIVDAAMSWFASFETFETALAAVEREPRRVLSDARPGSPAQRDAIERLRAAIERTTPDRP